KLVDFGLAKFTQDPALTRPDELVGSVSYMAPEVVRGEPASPSSDAFALGMVALEALLGTCPVTGPTDAAAARLAKGEVPRAQALVPKAPAALVAVVDGLLEPSSERRMTLALARASLFPLGTQAQGA
ncbi:protein kinase, partial [bacterium]|nr:protein kinase [bacterium]